MALCPFAVHLLIPPGSSDPAIKPRVAVLHVDAGGASSLFSYFRDRSGGIESHFHIRWDGTIEQYRDTGFQADANLKANDFAVSIETQGFGNGKWTPAQLASIKRLLLWLKEEHGIPLVRCSGPFGAGVGYHTMWGSPSDWTPVAKSCPGPNRIAQFDSDIVPWMESVSTPPKPVRRTRLSVARRRRPG
jgi:N-acetyl-anhydromuramyl-L-alanine amidase AmpD